jgi:hypothetical protein
LRDALARYIGTDASRVIAGAGLDDVFNTLAMTIIEPGDGVIISEPTFGVYRHMFGLHGAAIVDVPLNREAGFSLDVDGILAAIDERTKLVIVCNPRRMSLWRSTKRTRSSAASIISILPIAARTSCSFALSASSPASPDSASAMGSFRLP